jgi:hypothetical protein
MSGTHSWLLVLLAVIVNNACNTQMVCNEPGPGHRCVQTGSGPGEAAIVGAAGAGMWLAGGGCKIAACHPPLVCNQQSGLCEHAICGEGYPRCPDRTSCDSRTHTCR